MKNAVWQVSWAVFHVGLWCFVLSHPANADETTAFRTGKALQTALSAKISWVSEGLELGDQLRELQQKAGIAILRDRRIDPHRQISVKTEFVPRVQVLSEMSATVPDGAFCLTEHLACVGPAAAIYRLPILLERNNAALSARRKQFDSNTLRKLMANADASWEQLAEPRQILLDHAKSVGVVIKNPDAIPHDVWAAERLPKMPFVELATIVLNQFDQTFVFANDRPEITVIPIDDQESVEHRYVVGSQLKPAVTAAWQSRAPEIELKWTGSTAVVTTTLSQHTILSALLHELQYSKGTAGAAVEGSIRTTKYQFKSEPATIGQLIGYFRSVNVPIEVIDENDAATQAILQQIIPLDQFTDSQPGSKFFPKIFGKHFKSVDVRDDRVVLSAQ